MEDQNGLDAFAKMMLGDNTTESALILALKANIKLLEVLSQSLLILRIGLKMSAMQ